METVECRIAIQQVSAYVADPRSEDGGLVAALEHMRHCPHCSHRIGYLVQALSSGAVDQLNCQTCQERLPEYAANVAAGQAGGKLRAVAVHLALCPHCAAKYDELLELIALAQGERGAELPSYPVLDLSFLNATTTRPWHLEGLGRLVIEFTSELLAGLRMAEPALTPIGLKTDAPATALRPFTLIGEVEDEDVTITVKPARGEPAHCTVIVQVDIPSRGGWPNLGGTLVTLRRGAVMLNSQTTDDLGNAVFERVATDDLAQLVFVIEREIDV
jgi:hypothetical protein